MHGVTKAAGPWIETLERRQLLTAAFQGVVGFPHNAVEQTQGAGDGSNDLFVVSSSGGDWWYSTSATPITYSLSRIHADGQLCWTRPFDNWVGQIVPDGSGGVWASIVSADSSRLLHLGLHGKTIADRPYKAAYADYPDEKWDFYSRSVVNHQGQLLEISGNWVSDDHRERVRTFDSNGELVATRDLDSLGLSYISCITVASDDSIYLGGTPAEKGGACIVHLSGLDTVSYVPAPDKAGSVVGLGVDAGDNLYAAYSIETGVATASFSLTPQPLADAQVSDAEPPDSPIPVVLLPPDVPVVPPRPLYSESEYTTKVVSYDASGTMRWQNDLSVALPGFPIELHANARGDVAVSYHNHMVLNGCGGGTPDGMAELDSDGKLAWFDSDREISGITLTDDGGFFALVGNYSNIPGPGPDLVGFVGVRDSRVRLNQSGLLKIRGDAVLPNSIYVSVEEGVLSVDMNGELQTFDAAQVQRLRILGGAGDDAITLDGTVTQPAVVRGRAGNDTITGGSGDDRIFGGSGNDSIRGGAGNDVISGRSGRDTLAGDAGSDVLMGDLGRDLLLGESPSDILRGGRGIDRVRWVGGAG